MAYVDIVIELINNTVYMFRSSLQKNLSLTRWKNITFF